MKRRLTSWTGIRISILAVGMIAAATALSDVGQIKIPWGSAPSISEADARHVVGRVLSNVYQSFRCRGEDEVYDALSVSLEGDVLQDLYLQIQESLRMAEQGGAVARVKQVDLLESQLQPADPGDESEVREQSFSCWCRWNVSGTVEHWGHIHERTNQFEAVCLIEPVAESPGNETPESFHWKLTKLTITNSQRLNFETRLRPL